MNPPTATPTADTADHLDTQDVLELVADIQQRVDQLKQFELQEHHREQALAAREADLERRTEAFRENLQAAWDDLDHQRARLRQQRRDIARRFRALLKRRPAATAPPQPGRRDLDDERRALAQVKALLEDSEQEMLERYIGPSAWKLAMLAVLTLCALAGVSRWLAQQYVTTEARASMILAAPEGGIKYTALSSDPSLEMRSEPAGHVTLIYRAATPQDATAALDKLAADLRERNGSGGPFAQSGEAVRVVQPPTVMQSASQDRRRVAGIIFGVGVGVMLLLVLFHRIRIARQPRIFDERLERALAILESR